jgi:Anti-sigma factor NepR
MGHDPCDYGGKMNGKNGFGRPPEVVDKAKPPKEGESGRAARHFVGGRASKHVGAEGEMETSPDMQRPRPDDTQTPGMIDRSLQAQLGRQLRAIFEGIEEEPVPERFVRLLEALEAREKQR